ncbi:hypothetical protein MTYM_01632 [Methylococcales bacterium]|nr:hypothetical protein MTYM_01632 [Methylococcales bacterium]
MTNHVNTCHICNTEDTHKTFIVREMMFGTREEFEYFQCRKCGCLQITESPTDLSRFYPSNYYSYNRSLTIRKETATLKPLIKARVNCALFGKYYKFSKIASRFVDLPPEFYLAAPWLKKCQIKSFDANFLDVGCGSTSWWLNILKSIGFDNLIGVDPYIENDSQNNGIKITKNHLENISDKYDLITLHHSFEHIPNQLETFKSIRSALKPNGFCLMRIPLVSSDVWEKYGVNWIELDAPRHLYLHSLRSIELLARNSRFELVDFICDSTEFEFWGSEQYQRNIPLNAENSFSIDPFNSEFTYREMGEFKKMAEEANKTNKGGRGCLFFKAID